MGRTCVLQSPLTDDTTYPCIFVFYRLFSDDVKLTLDVLAEDVSIKSYILFANQTNVRIQNSNQESPIRIQLRASRYLASNEDYEDVLVIYVVDVSCAIDITTGRLLLESKLYPASFVDIVSGTSVSICAFLQLRVCLQCKDITICKLRTSHLQLSNCGYQEGFWEWKSPVISRTVDRFQRGSRI